MSPDGKWRVHEGPKKDKLAVREASSNKLVFAKSQTYREVDFSPDSKLLAAIAPDRVIVWHVPSGNEAFPPLNAAQVAELAYSPDSKLLAMADANRVVKIWDLAQHAETRNQKR